MGTETKAAKQCYISLAKAGKCFSGMISPDELWAGSNQPVSCGVVAPVYMCGRRLLFVRLHTGIPLLGRADSDFSSSGPGMLYLRSWRWQLTGSVLSHMRFQVYSFLLLHDAICLTSFSQYKNPVQWTCVLDRITPVVHECCLHVWFCTGFYS